jgi:hypothetical protein
MKLVFFAIGLCGLTAFTTGCGRTPSSPTPLQPDVAASGSTAVVSSQQAFAIERAIESCGAQGDIVAVLGAFFPGSIGTFSDDPATGTFTFGVTAGEHSSSHVIKYVDNGSGGFGCGDDVTWVDGVDVDP